MAISATIFKAVLTIADMNRHYYQQHELTVAQHPSENNFRFMVRLIAFALNASEELTFTKGLSTDDEPELWQKSLTGEIELWVDFGQVDEKRIRKACGRAKEVRLYTYNDRKSTVWWKQNQNKYKRYKNLNVYHLHADGCDDLVSRKMELLFNIDDHEVSVSNEETAVTVRVKKLEIVE